MVNESKALDTFESIRSIRTRDYGEKSFDSYREALEVLAEDLDCALAVETWRS